MMNVYALTAYESIDALEGKLANGANISVML
jgi:hypothetical protein